MLGLQNQIAGVVRSFVLVFFAVLVLAGNTAAQDVQYDQSKLAEIGTKLDQLYESGVIPNYVVDIRRAGQPVYFRARGNTELGGNLPVSDQSVYVLASMSKPIVSTAVLKLIEDGRLGLDDPLAKYFPQFESMLVAPNGDLDAPFEEAKQAITIRHLLTHTSGFTYPPQVLGVGDVAQQYDDIGLMWGAASTSEEFADILSQIPLVAHPGDTFNYSVSIDVLGGIIEQVTGKRLSAYLKEAIFQPLGMTSTDFYVPDEMRARMPRVYGPATPNNPAPLIEGDPIEWQISEALYFGMPFEQIGRKRSMDSGGGGLFSTSSDFLQYAQMVANYGELDGKRILKRETAELHFQDLMPNLGLEAFRANFGDAANFMKFGGGFGIKMEEDGSGKTDYYFWGGAANTFFWIDGEDQSVGAFFTHIAPPRYNMTDQIEDIVDRARIK